MVRPTAVALVFALVGFTFVPAASAATPLFPTPLHITRQVHEPISGKTTVLEEYAQGNRLVSVRGARTSIADYDKGELMEIDREAGTYSVTRFEAIARATQLANANTPPVPVRHGQHEIHSAGIRTSKLGRNAEVFETEIDGEVKADLEVAVDRSVLLTRPALEVLLGAAYPGVHRAEHDAVLSAAGSGRRPVASNSSQGGAAEAIYALPVEQSVRYEVEGQTIEIRTNVVRVGTEVPPADLLSIPAGARLVVSRIVAVSEELERLDRVTPPAADHQ